MNNHQFKGYEGVVAAASFWGPSHQRRGKKHPKKHIEFMICCAVGQFRASAGRRMVPSSGFMKPRRSILRSSDVCGEHVIVGEQGE